MSPTTAQRLALGHMVVCDAWLDGDPIGVTYATLRALERNSWVRLERKGEAIIAAHITALGRAVIKWGRVELITSTAA